MYLSHSPPTLRSVGFALSRRCLFFFSSRRRHTRCLSDWSSDVCSSDLMHERALLGAGLQITFKRQFARLVELAHRIERNGRPAAQDPVIRQKLAQCYAEIEIMR